MVYIPGESFSGEVWNSTFEGVERAIRLKQLIATLRPGEILVMADGNEVARGSDIVDLDKRKLDFKKNNNFTGVFYSYSKEE